MMKKRSQRVFVGMSIVAGAVLLAGAFLFFPSWQTGPEDTPGFYRPGSWPGLAHEHVPGAKGRLNGVEVRINSAGLRGEEFSLEKRVGITRVIVMGDSVVFGQGVEEAETLPVHLQALLAERAPAKKWEVLNGGVRGYNSADYRIVLERRLLPLQPDALLLVLTEINDPERKPFAPVSDQIRKWEKQRWRRLPLIRHLLAGAYAKEVNRLFTSHVKEIYDPAGEDWQGFVADITAIRDLCRQAGVPLLVVPFPFLSREDLFAAEHRQLLDLLSQLGLSWVDPQPILRKYPDRRLVVSKTDFHPNSLALRITAELITNFLLTYDFTRNSASSFSCDTPGKENLPP